MNNRDVTEGRRQAIQEMVRLGMSYTEVGAVYGISRQRIEQIVHPDRFAARRADWLKTKNGREHSRRSRSRHYYANRKVKRPRKEAP